MNTRTCIVPPAAATVIRAFGEEARFLLSAPQTGSACTLFEEITPAGLGPPPHYHQREDEWFHVLEGRPEFLAGGRWHEVAVGTSVFVPKNALHTFRNAGSAPLRLLITTAPSGFETFFAMSAEEFRKPGGPDMGRVLAIAAEHGVVIQPPGAPEPVPAVPAARPPAFVRPSETRPQQLFGTSITVHLGPRQTGGSVTTFVEVTPPGGGPPPHRLPKYDEWFYVLEGRMSFFGNGTWTPVPPGTAFFSARGEVHTYRNEGSTPARLLVQTAPSGIEAFFDAAEAEFARPGGPDMGRAMAIAAAHGIEFT